MNTTTHRNEKKILVFISCPNDVLDEVAIIKDVCDSLDKQSQRTHGVQVEPIYWQDDIRPQVHMDGPQGAIDKYLEFKQCQIHVSIFWQRFGEKMKNGLTPSEHEYYESYKRWSNTSLPHIQIYFKKKDRTPANKYESEQLSALYEFRDKIFDQAFWKKFCGDLDFYKKTNDYLSECIDEIIKSSEEIPDIQLILTWNMSEVETENYIPRYIEKYEGDSSRASYLYGDNAKLNLYKLANQKKRIVLIGSAGTGKTTELKNLCRNLYEKNHGSCPIFLSLSKYTNERIENILPEYWKKFTQDQVFIALDGFDEVPTNNRILLIRHIRKFISDYPLVRIVVSSRPNFFTGGSGNSPTTLEGFEVYKLMSLEDEQIENHLKKQIGNKSEELIDGARNSRLDYLLKIPVFMNMFVNMIRDNREYPSSKVEILEDAIKNCITYDEHKYSTTIELPQVRDHITRLLDRLACIMEVLGRNYITTEEYHVIIPDQDDRKKLDYYTIWKKEEGESTRWKFQHNSIQEYLAARFLSKHSIDQVKDIIVITELNDRIIPSWANTVSLIASIINNGEFNEWLLSNQPDVFVYCDPEIVSSELRYQLLQVLLDRHKALDILFDERRYPPDILASFARTEDTLRYLKQEIIEYRNSQVSAMNALKVLQFYDVPFASKEDIAKDVIQVACDENASKYLRMQAILAIADANLSTPTSKQTLSQVVLASTSDEIRYSAYYMYVVGDSVDQHIDIFLNGIQYLRRSYGEEEKTNRLFDESYWLGIGLENIHSSKGFISMSQYFENNPKDVRDTYLDKNIIKLYNDKADEFLAEHDAYDAACRCLFSLIEEHVENVANVISEKLSNHDSHKLITALLDHIHENKDSSGYFYVHNILQCISKSTLKIVIDKCNKCEVDEYLIRSIHDSLFNRDHELGLLLNEGLRSKTSFKIPIPIIRDYDLEKQNKAQKDWDMLFDQDEYIKAIEHIFKVIGKDTIHCEDDNSHEYWQKVYNDPSASNQAWKYINQLFYEKPVSCDDVVTHLKARWEFYQISQIYENYPATIGRTQKRPANNITVNDDQKEWIAAWSYNNVESVDFKNAIKKKGEGTSYSITINAVYLCFFLQELSLDFESEVLLDMLSFDWYDNNLSGGIGYIEERLPASKVRDRIIANLKDGITFSGVLRNHIDYVKRHKIKESHEDIVRILLDESRESYIRENALDTVAELTDDIKNIVDLYEKLHGSLRFKLVELVMHIDKVLLIDKLKESYNSSEGEDKHPYAIRLASTGHIDGLTTFRDWIATQYSFDDSMTDKHHLFSGVEKIEALPILMDILKRCYADDFTESEFLPLSQMVLIGIRSIAVQSAENHVAVNEILKEYIEDKRTSAQSKRSIRYFLSNLEEEYRTAWSPTYTVEEAIRKLDSLN